MILTMLAAILPSVLLPALKAWLETRSNAETTARETGLAIIRERQEARLVRSEERRDLARLRAETTQKAMSHWPFWAAWMTFALPLGMWWAAVMFDTVFGFAGDVADLPESVRPWANDIFTSLFWTGTGMAATQVVSKALSQR
jgi:hypothetical protein